MKAYMFIFGFRAYGLHTRTRKIKKESNNDPGIRGRRVHLRCAGRLATGGLPLG